MKLMNCPAMYDDFIFTEYRLRRYIKRLNSGNASGTDKITPDHITNALNSKLVLHLCNLFAFCFIHGVVPKSFTEGILVPILKTSTLDPSVASNYRPIIVSTVFSKLVEMFIMEKCNGSSYSDYQFGFVEGRGTNIAIAPCT